MKQTSLLAILLCILSAVTVWSGTHPRDPQVWWFELALGFVGVFVALVTYRKYPLSNVVYVLIALHYVVLAVGAKYTYAEVPLFNWLRDTWELSRNHYDRVGHFAQGFCPVLIIREVLLRSSPLKRGKLLFALCVSVCVALSAVYELLEMCMVLLFYSQHGPSWLGFQGDDWDAQWDMTMCLVGAVLAYGLLRRLHDRSIERLFVDRARRHRFSG